MRNSYTSFGHCLPRFISRRLFGDRSSFGTVADREDPDWKAWEKVYLDLYHYVHKQGVGKIISEAGYKVLDTVDLNGKDVLEIGPGQIPHMGHWRGIPKRYDIVDVSSRMLDDTGKILAAKGINYCSKLLPPDNSGQLPFEAQSFDVLISFYSLEHIFPIKPYLLELNRVLRPGGLLVGAIPCEGGFIWGLGRFLTSRRWMIRTMKINYDKIICWEHPNFAETVLNSLMETFEKGKVSLWPFGFLGIDFSFVASFKFRKI
jgi:SAM-dependent methyltransferase